MRGADYGQLKLNIERAVGRIKLEVNYYRCVLDDPRTPDSSRWLLRIALAYLLSPIDLIPDFIPIIGHLDDLLIVGGLVILARLRIPNSVLIACRQRDEGGKANTKDDHN